MDNIYDAGIVITTDAAPSIESMVGIIESIESLEDHTRTFNNSCGFTCLDSGNLYASEFSHNLIGVSENAVTAATSLDGVAAAAVAAGETGGDGLDKITNKAGTLASSIRGLYNAIVGLATSGLFQLDQQAARLHGRLGQGKSATDEFKSSVLKLSKETKIAPEIIGDLAFNLRSAGLEFKTNSKEAVENAKVMSHLVGTLGLSVEEVTKFAASARMMGVSIKTLTNQVSKFERQFGVPELLEELPGITQDVIAAQAQYGKLVVGDSKKITYAITRMAAVYSKALGKTAAEAAKDARESFLAFSGEVSGFQDVFLGLADDFTPLQNAFIEAGTGVGRLGSLMKKAQTDQAGFVNEVQKIRARLDPTMSERFYRQVLRNAPKAVKLLLTQEDAWRRMNTTQRKAELERRKAAKEQSARDAAFSGMITNMRNNVIEFYSLFQNLIRTLQTTMALDFVEVLKAGFKGLGTVVLKVADAYIVLRSAFRFLTGAEAEGVRNNISEINKTMAGTAVAIGGVAASVKLTGPAIRGVSAGLGALGKVALIPLSLFGKFSLIAGQLGIGMVRLIPGVETVTRGIAKFGRALKVFATLGVAPRLRAMTEVLAILGNRILRVGRVIGNTKLGRLGKILGSALVKSITAIVGSVGSLFKLFGGPARAGIGVIGRLGKVFGKLATPLKFVGKLFGKILLPLGVIMSVFEGFKDRIGNITSAFKEGNWGRLFKEILGGLGDSVDSFFMGLPSKFLEGFNNVGQKMSTEGAETMGASVGKFLGSIIKKISKWAKDDLGSGISSWLSWDKIYNDAVLPLLSGFANVGNQILGFMKGTATGILDEFGLSFDAIPLLGKKAFLQLLENVIIDAPKIGQEIIHALKVSWARFSFKGMLNKITAGAKAMAAIVTDIFASLLRKIAGFIDSNTALKKVFEWFGGTSKSLIDAAKKNEEASRLIRANAKASAELSKEDRAAAKKAADEEVKKLEAAHKKTISMIEGTRKEMGFSKGMAEIDAEIEENRRRHSQRKTTLTIPQRASPGVVAQELAAGVHKQRTEDALKGMMERLAKRGATGNLEELRQLVTLLRGLTGDNAKVLASALKQNRNISAEGLSRMGMKPDAARQASELIIRLGPTDEGRDLLSRGIAGVAIRDIQESVIGG